MRVTKYSHSCLRIEHDDAVVVIDPGVWSESEKALDGVDAVLITHEHADHVDADQLAEALAKRPSAQIYAHPDVVDKFAAQWEGAAVPVTSGHAFTAATVLVKAYGGWHAVIHPDIPRVPNLGFLVNETLYHPGDSFDVPADANVRTLFVPVSGPWLKLSESIDFVRAVQPQQAYALHDCLYNEQGLALTDAHLTARSGADYARLAAGTTVEV
ncbi:MBL fold metallo-hydrolase [Catellatospora tritici]|uniref:MBL fold metallo-hydrolase n=1 Tax=Catellatospora tritici TaxID=2851566 RepID=UPI001C2CEF47|nr:MBL fold metallo-hydrolase [Catellatospora tritici]MBV1849126.1 MBL fold metallo-hydrolase [Catellatospora tritici]